MGKMISISQIVKKQKKFSLLSEGSSMKPFLLSGDVVFYEKCNFSSCKVNDLVLIQQNKKLFTHRVIYKTDRYIIAKGDNNSEADKKVRPAQILAKVKEVRRGKIIFQPDDVYLTQSIHYLQEIQNIHNLFEKEHIGYVILKGLPIHLHYEGAHPKRIYADCDVLIEKKNFSKADKLLTKKGYKKIEDRFFNIKKDKNVELSYIKKINGFWVVFDIHLEPAFLMTQLGSLDCFYPNNLLVEYSTYLLKRRKKIFLGNGQVFILDTPDLLVYLALHFFHHNFTGIFRLELMKNCIKKIPRKCYVKAQKQIVEIICRFLLKNYTYYSFLLLTYYFPETKKFLTPILKAILPDKIQLLYLQKLPISVFNDEERTKSGIERFKNLFFLSPHSLQKKTKVFFDLQVLLIIFQVGIRRVFSFFSARR